MAIRLLSGETVAGNIRTGTSTETANTNFDNIVIEDKSGHSGMTIFSDRSSDGAIYFGDDDANNLGQIKYSHGSNAMTFATNDGAASLTLDSGLNATFGGTIGIGATPTANAIEIDGADGTSYVFFKSAAATTGARVGLNSDDLIIENKQASGHMIFDTNATERMRIDSAGRLLVGVAGVIASSSEKFTVDAGAGGIAFYGAGGSDTVATMYLKNNDTTADTWQTYMIFTDGGNRGQFGIKTTTARLAMSGSGGIELKTGATALASSTTALTLDTSQNATFAGNLIIHDGSNAPYIDFVENADTADSKARITMDQIDTNNGQLIFSTENAGTLTTALTINQTQNATFEGNITLAATKTLKYADDKIKIGGTSNTPGAEGIQIGYAADSSGAQGIGMGYAANATGNQSIAMGYNPTASGTYSQAFGYNVTASGSGTVVFGTSGSYSDVDTFVLSGLVLKVTGTGTSSFLGAVSITDMATISYSDISSGENRGLRIINSSGTDQQWNITTGITGSENESFCIRDATADVNAFTMAISSGNASFAGSGTFADTITSSKSTDAGIGGQLILKNAHNSDNTNEIQFEHRSSGYAVSKIESLSVDGGNNTRLLFKTESASTIATRLTLDEDGDATFTGDVNALLFKVEQGDTSTNITAASDYGIWLKNTSDTDGNFIPISFSNSTGFETARIGAEFQDAGDRNTDLYFCTRANSGVLTEALRIDSSQRIVVGSDKVIWAGGYGGGLVIRQNNATSDRLIKMVTVDSAGAVANDDVLVVRGDKVGIGTDDPANLLDVGGGLVVDPTIRIDSASGGSPQIIFDASQADRSAHIKFYDNGSVVGGFIDYLHNGDKMNFGSGSSSTVTMTVGDTKVGIGVDDPDSKLEIKGTGATTERTFKTTDSSSNETFYILDGGRAGLRWYPFSIGVPSSDTTSIPASARFFIDGTSVDVTVASTGYMGIGTTDPAELLTLNKASGAVGILLEGNGTDVGKFRIPSAGVNHAIQLGTISNNQLEFHTNDTERMRIQNTTGYVGINDTSPDNYLHVTTATGQPARFEATGQYTSLIEFKSLGTAALPSVGAAGDDYVIWTNGAERVRINSSGNVGISTTNPNQMGIGASNTALTVKGKTSGGEAGLELIGLGNVSSDNVARISFLSQAETTAMADIRAIRYTSDTEGSLAFHTSGSEAMRINNIRDVLIGNTVVNPASGFSDQRGFGYDNSTGNVQIAGTSGTALEVGRNEASAGDILTLRKQSTITHTFASHLTTIKTPVAIDSQASDTQIEFLQQFTMSCTAAATTVAKNMVYVSHTHAINFTIIAKQDSSNVGSLTGNMATAYGSNGGVFTRASYIGNVTAIGVAYNNTGYYMDVDVTYTGTAPTVYITVHGQSDQVIIRSSVCTP